MVSRIDAGMPACPQVDVQVHEHCVLMTTDPFMRRSFLITQPRQVGPYDSYGVPVSGVGVTKIPNHCVRHL